MHETKPDIPLILSRLPLFQELAPEQISAITAATRERRLTRGEMLFQKGDPCKGFFVITMGQIKLAFPSSMGHEKVIEILGPRQSFGEAVMFMDRPFPVFAEALTDCVLLQIGAQGIFDLLGEDTMFAKRMLAGLSQRLHALVQDVESLSQRSSTQRVIGYLIQHCPADHDCTGTLEIELPTSKQIIASRLNLTPETLSRVFNDLSHQRLITVHGKQITINDVKRLREFDL
jgi:CRP-like cAMP-binding protein